ncbi:divalent-cation tolerance protein CutA [Candidatus Woesearchaeota archaeon]|nr:divalent-cation tolerance protein CutA [Candidatus Woesearchaeota archaeon]
MILVYVTHENLDQAQKIVNHLIQKRLIACANYFPITSSYWWENKLENSDEIVSLLKTKEENWGAVKAEILKIHPYKNPCILKMNVEANEEYERWVREETNSVLE